MEIRNILILIAVLVLISAVFGKRGEPVKVSAPAIERPHVHKHKAKQARETTEIPAETPVIPVVVPPPTPQRVVYVPTPVPVSYVQPTPQVTLNVEVGNGRYPNRYYNNGYGRYNNCQESDIPRPFNFQRAYGIRLNDPDHHHGNRNGGRGHGN